MLVFEKILYGVNRLKDELISREDYWHVRLKPYSDMSRVKTQVYYLDMTPKAFYPGEMKDGIPIFYLNGIYPVYFHITVLNYGLGLFNLKAKGENVDEQIRAVLDYLVVNQGEDGGWRYHFPEGAVHELAGNKVSGMTQGLAISFLTRCYYCGFWNKDDCSKVLTRAHNMLLSKECVSIINGYRFIEEFYSPGASILNGSLFALLGLYDYCNFMSNTKEFDSLIADLKSLIYKFDFHQWSYYDLKGTICSRFYQQLHVDLLDVFYNLTNDELFRTLSVRWSNVRLPALFICLKAFQKLFHIKKMEMSFADKQ